MSKRLDAKRGESRSPVARDAVAELARSLDVRAPTFVFASSDYDLPALADALRSSFEGPLVACTTAGQIGPTGFSRCGLVGVSLTSEYMRVKTFPIRGLRRGEMNLTPTVDAVRDWMSGETVGARRAFGLLLVDGMSIAEERLVAGLNHALPDVALTGGSAGDDLLFERTHVLVGDRFESNAASLTVVQTDLPFAALKFQHFEPTSKRTVVTGADPNARVVQELDGEPAASRYADLTGVSVQDLSPRHFSANPVMLHLGGQHWVRSIQRANADLSLSFYCAIDEGIVLSLGRSLDPTITARRAFDEVRARIGPPEVVLGFDCILRRLELEASGALPGIGTLFAENRVIGFSTYGEQMDGVHVNQTFTGVAIGG